MSVRIFSMDVRKKLNEARLYLCTPGFADLQRFSDFAEQVLAGGVDIIQLRDRSLDVLTELKYYEILTALAAKKGALVAVNDRADLVRATGAHLLHLGQRDLPPHLAREIVGQQVLIGRSTSGGQFAMQAAGDTEIDYFCVGPVWETPTKPGRANIALEGLAQTAAQLKTQHVTKPWFAIGGITASNLEQVQQAGATKVVVVRALTEAKDPYEATCSLKKRLLEF